MQVKKQQLEPDKKQWTGSKLGKEYIKIVYCHPACLNFRQSTSGFPGGSASKEYTMQKEGLDESKLESRLQGEISITSDMQMTPPL